MPLSHTITYGPDEQRVKTIYIDTVNTKTIRFYAGNYEKDSIIIGASKTTKKIHYISGGTGLVAVYIKWSTGQDSMFYVCTDRQGSITALLKQTGVVSERYSYDAYGRRRNPTNWNDYNVKAPRLISRGYTGHEHLDGFGLINMNGRMYDPVIGRVLSPDKVVQAPGYTQSYNRYSYCMNNPLKYTDPSGWYTAAEINTAIDQMWSYGFGGFWTPGSSPTAYSAQEGYGYYMEYNKINGWAARSSMGSSLSSYFTSNASAVSALGFSNRVTNFDAGMQSWLLSADGLFTNYQSFVNNKTFQLVVDGNNKVVYYNSTGFVVPVVSTSNGGVNAWDYIDNTSFILESATEARLAFEIEIFRQARINRQIASSFEKIIPNSIRAISRTGKIFGSIGVAANWGEAVYEVANGRDNTHTWINAVSSTGLLIVAIAGGPITAGIALGIGIVWGVSQFVAEDSINTLIDKRFGYR